MKKLILILSLTFFNSSYIFAGVTECVVKLYDYKTGHDSEIIGKVKSNRIDISFSLPSRFYNKCQLTYPYAKEADGGNQIACYFDELQNHLVVSDRTVEDKSPSAVNRLDIRYKDMHFEIRGFCR